MLDPPHYSRTKIYAARTSLGSNRYRSISAARARRPPLLLSIDGTADGQTDGRTDGRTLDLFVTLAAYYADRVIAGPRHISQRVCGTHVGSTFSPGGDVFDVSSVWIVDVALHHATAADAARLADGRAAASRPRLLLLLLLPCAARHVPPRNYTTAPHADMRYIVSVIRLRCTTCHHHYHEQQQQHLQR